MSLRNRLIWLFAVVGGGLLLPACQLFATVISHPRPQLAVSTDTFSDVGCPPDPYGFRTCEKDSSLAALGCDAIRYPSDLLGGLKPSYPIAYCLIEPGRHPPDMQQLSEFKADKQFVYQDGCMIPVFIRYAISRDGKFQIIKTPDEFRRAFAPIESEDEALSYALALTDLRALYDFDIELDFRYFTDKIETTHVDKTDNGFQVHLFHYEACGCGPHTMSAVTVHVKTDGTLERQNNQPLYEDPKLDNLCVD